MNLLEFIFTWGRLVPRVSFSSDEQGMPWEIMGVYYYFSSNPLHLVSHRVKKQDLAPN
ncbi:hypothetical protein GGR95_001258 [Sulfitobacter undariae]|uniref:Uncharacterized protein n=1 Tax=Sulfitobacter undariae TaxID=1563671 RepID=A0A7W6E6N0_9RHOB|nr:hypothetical protein [Sulfitobacter undariae]